MLDEGRVCIIVYYIQPCLSLCLHPKGNLNTEILLCSIKKQYHTFIMTCICISHSSETKIITELLKFISLEVDPGSLYKRQ